MTSEQWAAWWADVGGQVVASLVVLFVAAVLAAITPWGQRVRSRIGKGLRAALRFARSLRVTTRLRIDAEIAEAVREAIEPEPDHDEARPLRPDEYRGWVMARAPEARTWLLRNQTGEDATLMLLMMGHNSGFEYEPPDTPYVLGAGESVSFPARRVRTSMSFLPFMDRPEANVIWEDSHGDQHEDLVWIVVDR